MRRCSPSRTAYPTARSGCRASMSSSEVGPLHAERPQDAGPDKIVPALPADALEDQAGHEIHEITVLPGAVKRLAGFEMPQRGKYAGMVRWPSTCTPSCRGSPVRWVKRSRKLACSVVTGSRSRNSGNTARTGMSQSSRPSSTSNARAVAVRILSRSRWRLVRQPNPTVVRGGLRARRKQCREHFKYVTPRQVAAP